MKHRSSRKAAKHGRRHEGTPQRPPGTLVAQPEMAPPRIDVFTYGPESCEVAHGATPASAAAAVGTQPVAWIDVDGLGDAGLIGELGQKLSIHALALEDVLNTHQRPKAESYGDLVFVVLWMIHTGESLGKEQLSVVIGKNFVVTFQEVNHPGDCLDNLRLRLVNKTGRLHLNGADYLGYAIIDAVVDHYFPILEDLGERLESIEDEIQEGASSDTPSRIHHIRRDLMMLRRTIWPVRDLVSSLLHNPPPHFSADTLLYLRDCHDHATRLIDLLENQREFAAGLMEYYLSNVSLRMNEVMKVLTVIATIFMPMSFIAGLYGMNFDTAGSPFNMPELGWKFGYFFALSMMLSVAIGMLLFFRRKGWIGGKHSGADREESPQKGADVT